MQVSDVDIEIIHRLLLSVPGGMEIESINLTDGYSLRLIAGTNEIDKLEYERALNELRAVINGNDKRRKRLK
ncbi:MAG: hypothetical protein J1E36_08345 [Eubacterium sp.]|nr:hypothetical protein [Eubacterium sp.]